MPYMVYLKLPTSSKKFNEYRRWMCGGIIVHDDYILTSAACIEDVGHFYVVAGTTKFSYEDDRLNNQCIKNGAKKAVWKCIPRNYVFDGHENDNIRWMNNDIAVVRVEDEFDFTRRVRGCDHIPKPIMYNNESATHEEPEEEAWIAGWGSQYGYSAWVNSRRQRRDSEPIPLMDTKVKILDKPHCKIRWGSRYYNIIDNYMICTYDYGKQLSEICSEKYTQCTDLEIVDSDENIQRRWLTQQPDRSELVQYPPEGRRMDSRFLSGGFCENDHGGPLVKGTGVSSLAIGIISACLVKEQTNACYGPFLYTSIYKNRVLINCAIYKDTPQACNKAFRTGEGPVEVNMDWADHPDGPSKTEIRVMRRAEMDYRIKLGSNVTNLIIDENPTDIYEPEAIPVHKTGTKPTSGHLEAKFNEMEQKHFYKTAKQEHLNSTRNSNPENYTDSRPKTKNFTTPKNIEEAADNKTV